MVFKKGVWIGLMLCSVQCPAQNLIDFQNIFSGLESATALVTSSIELSILKVYLIYGANRSQSDTAKIFLFDGPSTASFKSFSLAYPVHLLENLNLNLPTMMYIHGYNDSARDESVRTIVNSYIQRGGFNILALDWSELCIGDYFRNAIPNVFMLAKILAKTLVGLFKHGLSLETFHLIGHSLGAQMAGLCGKEVKKLTDENIILHRITGLDPAGPGFGSKFLIHINRTDAVFVDIVHTDGNVFGMQEQCGTVDFFPNRGVRNQPGCTSISPIDPCSHQMCWRYWAESVSSNNPNAFLAMHFETWRDYLKANWTTDRISQMGIDCPRDSKGKYYLETNAMAPYSMT